MMFDPTPLCDLLLDFCNAGGRALGLLLLLALVAWITHRLLPRIVRRLVLATPPRFDDALSLLVLYLGIAAVPQLQDEAFTPIPRLLAALVVLFIARAISRFRMARQLEPTSSGVSLAVYCLTDTTLWVNYKGIQSDLFDPLLAILPEFGLRVFRSPGAGRTRGRGLGVVCGEGRACRAWSQGVSTRRTLISKLAVGALRSSGRRRAAR